MNNETMPAPHSQLSTHNSPLIPPGYKQTEVGIIPQDWETPELGEVLSSTQLGGNYKNGEQETNWPLIKMGNLGRGGIVLEKLEYIYQPVPPDDRDRLSADNILFNTRNTLDLVGKVAIWRNELPVAYFNSNIMRMDFDETRVHSHPLMNYALNSALALRELRGIAIGTTSVAAIYGRDLVKLRIPLPPTKAEQEAIAGALSDADALIESLEKLTAKKRQIKQGAMQELLTGKTRLPGFGGDWEERSFGEIFDYYPTATNSRSDLDSAGDTYYIHYGDIHMRFHSHLDFSVQLPPRIPRIQCRKAALLRNGDWVMADASEDYDGVGKSIEIQGLKEGVNAVAGLHTFLLREKAATFVPGFKGHLGSLKSLHDQFLRVATGMKVFGVSKAALQDLLLPIPEHDEQIAIAAILSDMDAEIAALETKLQKARQVKQGMMQELLTGRIRLINGELRMENGE